MNILLTSVGRRSYLVEWFKEALGSSGLVHVANSVVTPAFQCADASVVTPLIYDGGYIDFLMDYCRQNDISAMISLFDVDLPVLSRSRNLFLKDGIEIVVSDPSVIDICNDKWKTYRFLIENGIPCPKTYLCPEAFLEDEAKGLVSFPAIVKPRWGMGSIGVYEAVNGDELKALHLASREKALSTYLKYESSLDREHCIIIQEKLSGDEYGLDVVNDLGCRHVTTVVKRKLAMRAGETDSATVISNDELSSLGDRIAASLAHRGNLDVDAFLTASGPVVLEMNARFGGGYPFSHMAGVNLPRQIVMWLQGNGTDEGNFIHATGVSFQKEIELKPLLKAEEAPSIHEVESLGDLKDFLEALETRLSPSLSDRGIDIVSYAEKLFEYGIAYKAEASGRPVGLVAGYANDVESCTGYVSFLAVASGMAGLGIGGKLMHRFEVEAARRGMKSLAFEVHKDNNTAIAFYYHVGAHIEKDKDKESWIMRKDFDTQAIRFVGVGYSPLVALQAA